MERSLINPRVLIGSPLTTSAGTFPSSIPRASFRSFLSLDTTIYSKYMISGWLYNLFDDLSASPRARYEVPTFWTLRRNSIPRCWISTIYEYISYRLKIRIISFVSISSTNSSSSSAYTNWSTFHHFCHCFTLNTVQTTPIVLPLLPHGGSRVPRLSQISRSKPSIWYKVSIFIQTTIRKIYISV